MSSQAYYLAQFAIIIAFAVVIASAAGIDFLSDPSAAGTALGALGLSLIVGSIMIMRRRTHHHQ